HPRHRDLARDARHRRSAALERSRAGAGRRARTRGEQLRGRCAGAANTAMARARSAARTNYQRFVAEQPPATRQRSSTHPARRTRMCNDDTIDNSRRQLLKLAGLMGLAGGLPLLDVMQARAAAEPNAPVRI